MKDLKNNNSLRYKWLPYIVAFVIFIVLACIYCYPALEGKVVNAGDTHNFKGAIHEAQVYHEQTGKYTWWTNSMFSGMPNYQIGGGRSASSEWLTPLMKIFRLGHTYVIMMLFFYFLGFYLLLTSLKINRWLSIVGAIAMALSSYFLIIIPAGHNTKATTIAFMSIVIAGFYLIFQKKYGLGVILTMIFTTVGFYPHPQMSYYIFMFIGCLFIAEIYIHIKEKRYKDLVVATLLFVASVGVGMGTGFVGFLTNTEYAKETMRGGHSELVKEDDAVNKTKGLDLDYATAWSYGIDETMTLMIPNFKGASSNYSLGEKSDIYKALRNNGVPAANARQFCANVPTYWGTQPFTSGPVYVGAIICFLFLLGLLIVKGPYKWALFVATLLSIFLAWGHNFMPLTRFFFKYVPMYAKFRAVSSILIVAEITMPLLAFLSIKTIMDEKLDKKKLLKKVYVSAGITAGICLFFALFGKSIYSFTTPNDAQFAQQLPEWLMSAIIDERASMFVADSFRSFVFIALAALLLILFISGKLKQNLFIPILGVLILADMWPVDKRFFNSNDFISKNQDKNYFAQTDYEKMILQDKDPDFRVFNLATNTFNDSRTSYYLKSIGGYHGAKLRRYQDLIDQHISKNNWDVINMLNPKYIIFKNGDKIVAQPNPDAMGNAWFVDSLMIVNNPNAECDALKNINLHNTAVVDTSVYKSQFASLATSFVPGHDSTATIKLTQYAPDALDYESTSSKDATAVFSEIYYPYGWKVYVDDQPVELYRVNYMLRAINVPSGSHKIHFEFRPDSVRIGDRIAIAFVIIMYVTVLAIICYAIIKAKKHSDVN